MKVSALITKLKELKEIHGDLDVMVPEWNEDLGVCDGSVDYVDHVKVKSMRLGLNPPAADVEYLRIS